MHQHPLTIEVRPSAGSLTLALMGELDLSSAPTLRACLEQLDPGVEEIVVDLTDVSFMDSTGLALLVSTEHTLTTRGGRLTVRRPSGAVRRVLMVSGVDQLVSVEA